MSPFRNDQTIYLFLDESGNLDFSPKGTKYFVLTSIGLTQPSALLSEIDALRRCFLEVGQDSEYFHAAEDSRFVRNEVFGVIRNNLDEIRIDSLIVEKRKTSPALRAYERFYPEMLGYLLKFVLPREQCERAKKIIVIADSFPDKRKPKVMEKAVEKTLSKMIGDSCPYKFYNHSSRSHYGLQVADYCAWAVFRKQERGDASYYDYVKAGIASEFDIFRRGTRFYY